MCLWERVSLCDGDVKDWCQHATGGWAEFRRHSCTLVGCPVGEGSSDPSHCALVPAHHQCCYHFIDKFTSVKLESTLIQKVKCFYEIPCLVIPASALVKAGESEMEMQSISLNGGRKLALKTETKPQPQFYLFT